MFQENEQNLQNIVIDTTPVFTRYLYIINDVYWSLLCSLIHNNVDESLFWGYEIYYSGFKNELVKFIEFVFVECFEKVNSIKLKQFIEKKIVEWKIYSNKDWLIATIIANIAHRRNCIEDFIEKYGNVTTLKSKKEKNKKLILINYSENDIKKYKTIQVNSRMKNYKILKTVCNYATEKDPNKLLDIINCPFLESFIKIKYNRENIKNMYFYGWEYYCYFTPIWKDRIDRYKGNVDYMNKKVTFLDNLVDEFYDKFGYEPDEQPLEIHEKTIGIYM